MRTFTKRTIGCLFLTACLAQGTTINYDYDAAGRMVLATIDTGNQISYAYDANNNLLVREISGTGGVLFTLIYRADDGGTISGISTQTVAGGGSGSLVSAETNLYFQFAQWSDGITNNPRVDTNVIAHMNVAAEFDEIKTTQGTPIWWLVDQGYSNELDTAEASDDDQDGLTAQQEYIAGTDPHNKSSLLEVDIQNGPNSVPELNWHSVSGRVYSIWQSSNLVDWVAIQNQDQIEGDNNLKTISPEIDGNKRFFKINVSVQP